VAGDEDHWSGAKSTPASTPPIRGPDNRSGHIIEITEDGDDATATRFRWDVFLLAGNPAEGAYLVDAKELAPGKVGSTDTYFAGYPNAPT
jgi:secreted PhoX family phosphatase